MKKVLVAEAANSQYDDLHGTGFFPNAKIKWVYYDVKFHKIYTKKVYI